MSSELTREERYGKKPWVSMVWLMLLISPGFFSIYVTKQYPLEDANDPIILKVALCIYFIALPGCFFLRKKLMPYGPKIPLIYVFGILSFPVPLVLFITSAFLFLNAYLDSEQSYSVLYSVVTKYSHTQSLLIKTPQGSPKLITNVPLVVYTPSHVGSIVELKLGAGYFHQPWVKDCNLPTLSESY